MCGVLQSQGCSGNANARLSCFAAVLLICPYSCLTPPGSGSSVHVRVTVNRLVGLRVPLWRYIGPTITTLLPARLEPAGGSHLMINGTNFGPGGDGSSVTVDGRECAPVLHWDHSSIVCTAPLGVAAQAAVSVLVGDQKTAPVHMAAYHAPSVTDSYPREFQTEGKMNLTIVGQRFTTTDPFAVSVSLVLNGGRATLACPLVFGNSTVLVCSVPEGAGAGWVVRVTNTDGQTGKVQASSESSSDAVGVASLVAYVPPLVTSMYHVVGSSPAVGGFVVVVNGE